MCLGVESRDCPRRSEGMYNATARWTEQLREHLNLNGKYGDGNWCTTLLHLHIICLLLHYGWKFLNYLLHLIICFIVYDISPSPTLLSPYDSPCLFIFVACTLNYLIGDDVIRGIIDAWPRRLYPGSKIPSLGLSLWGISGEYPPLVSQGYTFTRTCRFLIGWCTSWASSSIPDATSLTDGS